MLQPSNEPKDSYSLEEVRDRVENLNAVELTKLRLIVSTRAKMFKYDREELFNEVLLKILSGDRKWPRKIDIFQLVSMVSKSILSNYVKKASRELSLDSMIEEQGEKNEAFEQLNHRQDEESSIEELRDRIFLIFGDDQIAKDLIFLKMDGCKKKEVLELMDISDTDYETKMKKIRRRIKKDFQGSLV